MSNPEIIYKPGDTVGRSLEVTRILGRGGFGIVYHVRSREDGSEYALKTYLRSASDKKADARFRQEAEIWVSLGQHPHIVQAFFADEFEGRLFVAMEFIPEGQQKRNSLDRILAFQLPTPRKVALWGIQICLGMEYARTRGIRSHRDLKPANIMVTPDGDVKITDFGLATFPGSTSDETDLSDAQRLMDAFKGQTVRGMGFGTPTHMPPEQFDDAGACDERSDVYAMGVILYQLLTGKIPFVVQNSVGTSLRSRMQYWKNMEKAHLSFKMPSLDSPLEPIIAKCLQVDPESRYQTFADLREDLGRIHTHMGGKPIDTPVATSMTGREWLERGNSFITLGRFAAALHCMDQAVLLGETGAVMLSGKARCLSGLERHLEAIPCHDAAVSLEPGKPDLLVYRGRTLLEAGFQERAAADFETALTLDPKHVSALHGLGIILEGKQQWTEAASLLDRALKISANRADILTDKGILCLRLGNLAEAVTAFRAALSVDNQFARARRFLAAYFTITGNHRKALAEYHLLHESAEMNREDHLFHAIALCESGQYSRAHESLNRVTGADLKLWTSMVRGRILLLEHRFEEALQAQNQGMRGVKPSIDVGLQRAIMMLYCAQAEPALSVAKQLLSEKKGHLETTIFALCAALEAGLPELGVELAEIALENGENSAHLCYNLGLCKAALGDFSGSIQAFRKAVDLRPYWPQAWTNLAHTAFESGEIELGLQSLNQAWRYREIHAEYWSVAREDFSVSHVCLEANLIPLSPLLTIRGQANGWSTRYRLPQFEYPVLLFPVVNPSILFTA